MNRSGFRAIIYIVMPISLALNLYLWNQNQSLRSSFDNKNSIYEDALHDQVATTTQLEMMLRASNVDISYDGMLSLANRVFSGRAQEVEAGPTQVEFGADLKAIKVLDSVFYFKEGKYWGSKIALPEI